jgi:acyl carrier protein
MNETLRELEPVFHDVFDSQAFVLTAETSAKDVEGWDSLNHVRLMLAVGRAFRTKFTAAEISRLQNVGDLVQLIDRKRVVQSAR